MKKILFVAEILAFTLFLLFPNTINAQIPSTQGQEFYVSFMKNGYRSCNGGPESENLTVIASSPRACQVTVRNPFTSWSTTVPVSANGIANILIPYNQAYNEYSEIITNNGLIVTSTDTISLYIANEATNSFDAANVLPVHVLGSEYMIQTYTPYAENTYCSNSDVGAFLIIATENNTIIDITPKKATAGGRPAGTPFTITLQRGQAYQVFSAQNGNNGDFSGSTIMARDQKKIAVFNGNILTGIPMYMDSGFDHIFEQAMPTSYWGKNFIVTSSLTSSGDYVRITALENNTVISKDNAYLATIHAGQTHEFFIMESQASHFIETSLPCAINLYQVTGTNGAHIGDPSMVWISPVEQNIKEINFATFSAQNIAYHYVNIVTLTQDIQSMRLDNNSIAGQFTPVPGNPDYSFARISISAGTHNLRSNTGFVAHVYGFGFAQGYAYSVGSNVRNLSQHLTVNGTPASELPPDFSICIGDSVLLGVETNYVYRSLKWDLGDGDSTGQNHFLHLYIDTGTFNVQVIIEFDQPNNNGDLFDTLYVDLPVYPRYSFHFNDTVCSGTWYNRYGFSFEANRDTVLYYTWTTVNGCDSIVSVDLSVNPSYGFEMERILCFPDSFFFGNRILTQTGIYYDSLQTRNGCDSVIRLSLKVGLPYDIYLTDHICPNVSYVKNGFSLPRHQQPGIYSYELNLISQDGCDSTVYLALSIPDVAVKIDSLTIDFCETRSAQLFAMTNNNRLMWSTGETGNPITVTKAGNYSVTVTENGCHSSDFITVPACPFTIILPNAITPGNADGINDDFHLINTDNIEEFQINIYDRWGTLVFTSKDVFFRWNGQVKGRIAYNNVFTYVIFVKPTEGPKQSIHGTITVL